MTLSDSVSRHALTLTPTPARNTFQNPKTRTTKNHCCSEVALSPWPSACPSLPCPWLLPSPLTLAPKLWALTLKTAEPTRAETQLTIWLSTTDAIIYESQVVFGATAMTMSTGRCGAYTRRWARAAKARSSRSCSAMAFNRVIQSVMNLCGKSSLVSRPSAVIAELRRRL